MSGRIVSAIVILLAMTGRTIQLVFFYNIRVDASYQVMAMQNFINGHGVSNAHVMPQDLSRVIYEPLVNWPPGYSLLLSPFYIISGQNYIVAGLALDICCALLLMYVSRAILKLFNTPVYLRNLFSLVTGFFIYSFYFIASSDAIAIAFFVTAIYQVLRLLEKKDPQTIKVLLFSGCLLLCGFIKYLFIPVVFITPCFLLLKGFINKEKNIQKAGMLSFFILAIGLGALLIYQKNISGTAAYISQPERGFFPGTSWIPIPFFPLLF